jgi:hypothetical protein
MEEAMGLNTVRDIEHAIEALTPRHPQQPIDACVQSDLAAGRLDKAIRRALDDEKNGRVQPL